MNGPLDLAMPSLEQDMLIDLAKHFSPYPSGRVPEDGTFNGERFRDEHLMTALDDLSSVENADQELVVDIDGVRSFGSSFLEEAFGGLIRKTKHDPQWAVSILKIKCTQSHLKMYHDSIEDYINDALSDRLAAN